MKLIQILNFRERMALLIVLSASILSLGFEIAALVIFLVLSSYLMYFTGGGDLVGFRELLFNYLTFHISSHEGKISILIGEITLIYLIKNYFGYSNILRLNSTILKIQNRIGENVYSKFFRLPYRKINALDTTEASASLIDSTNHAIAGQISFYLLGVIELFNILTILIVLSTQNAKITLIFIVFCASLLLLTYRVLRVKALANGSNLYQSTISSRMYFAQGKESIAIFSLSDRIPFFLENLSEERRKFTRSFLNSISLQQLPKYLIETYLIVSLFFLYLITQLFSGSKSSTQFILVFILAGFRILPSVTRLQALWLGLSDSKHRVDAFYRLYEYVIENSQKIESSELDKVSMPTGVILERIVGSHINFSYNDRVILNNLSFDAKPGTSILIKGASGSGKTTLLNIISGLVLPDSGSILYHLSDGSVYQANEFPYNIGYAPQHPIIFRGSIARNIVLKDQLNELDNNLVKEILSLVDTNGKWELSAFDENFILIGGMNMSGGERQRINIARALGRQASIVFMDEPTNSLDYNSAREIIESVTQYSLANNRIFFSTTHQQELHKYFEQTINL